MLLAVDSTDSRLGGCTTHAALAIWRRLSRFDVVGAPRLVRLNPNVPFKTRGNGALCLELGHGRGRRCRVACVDGTDLFAAEAIEEPTYDEAQEAFTVARRTIEELRAPGSDSGLL